MKNHKKKWTVDEETKLLSLIKKNSSIDVIVKMIERTESAIKTKANYLGFGHYCDKTVDKSYFHNEINHKNRRTKEELLADGIDKVPIPSTKAVEDFDKESTVSISQKNKGLASINLYRKLDELEDVAKQILQTISSIKAQR